MKPSSEHVQPEPNLAPIVEMPEVLLRAPPVPRKSRPLLTAAVLISYALVLAFIAFGWGIAALAYVALFGVALNLAVLVHQLGHFFIGRRFGAQVQTWCLGFGPPLPFCRWQRGPGTWKISLFPVGGYMTMGKPRPNPLLKLSLTPLPL